jgi:Ca2+-binding RTX toxin-like protein
VTDFAAGSDRIDVTDFGFADYSALSGSFVQNGGDIELGLDADDVITLIGIDIANLQESHFLI